ncbi:Cholesterol uptake protein 1 [Pseudolycoriella hygida]|uniref:Cholesterol uptake protein 1 n=1 Tax=Pseudolycoriella hygida TaxID=35572 RepID=A0A9Q0S575_9DIPT|nr:Cholesterol uptake protein 1 [Pseudolycoriella hygida]
MKLSNWFSIILSFSIVNIASVLAYNRTILHNIGTFNKLYASAVGRGVEIIYSFDLPENFNPLRTKIRVQLNTDEATETKFPLLATILQTHEPTSLILPVTIRDASDNVVRYFHASRTLCLHADHFDEDEQYFEIRITTSSTSVVLFELQVLEIENMALRLDHPVTFTASPTTPDFFYFQFPKTIGEMHIKVKVTSPYEKCAILSIQPSLCPVPHHAENVRVAGNQLENSAGWEWQTLTTKGAIVTSNKLMSTAGFFITLLVTKDDRQCGHLIENPLLPINMTTRFMVTLSNDQLVDLENVFWTLPVYLPIVVNLGILLICGGICIAIQVCCTGKKNRQTFVRSKTFNVVSVYDFNEDFEKKYGERKIPHTYFGKMIIIIAIFFAIPVFELTIYNVTVLHTTGDDDICYFNSFCAHPFGYLKDFNHLWSNMGYIIFGIGFIVITYLKNRLTAKDRSQTETRLNAADAVEKNAVGKLNPTTEAATKMGFGIPFKTGLYYAMGLALIMEGVMSSAYHICPNKSNFQYDTCFMFMIATMCILKIFDFRHPRNLGPNGIFTILALFSLLSASGIMLERYQLYSLLYIFKICLLVIHFYFIGFLSVYILYLGYPITYDRNLSCAGDIPHVFFIFPNFRRFARLTFRWHRLISVFFYCLINIALAVTILTFDFATLLLHFLIGNLIYYLLHYVLIKFVHGEFNLKCRSLQPLIYLLLTAVVSLISMHYFKIDLTEWRKSAAYSREGNGECVLWNFYDEHDIWHMYSAVAILFLYMTLLTMDDGVQDIPQNQLKLI